ncbi:L-fuconolactonase [Arthrobacter stackebrandtii]|uniref:L-fuconolactonase n=1 Tax=Arthrobacter stackebrandtii TaxID=272161 RepID=A0ABS4YUG4_9MICC|nr:amidohydrolase family protein [Arthrobacter stackebrandtii]MBP2412115.1 L-fuconolactonase [Arthrobacter stackebrandtii]
MASGTVSMPDGGTPARLDSHLHLWELGEGRYSWLQPTHGVLYDSFTAEQAREALSAAGIEQAILVQADDTAEDNEAMLAAADANDWIVGVVGWLPLEDPTASAALLETWGSNPKFRGVRTLIHDDPRANVLDLGPVRSTLALIEKAGLAFDVPNAYPRHLGQTAAIARDFPELTVVVDHLGKPPRAAGDASMAEWERQLRDVAAVPNTVAKVSGLFEGGVDFSAAALARTWDVALSAFGPERLMFGGDWPVSLLGGTYAETVSVIAGLIGSLSRAEAQAVWAGTARRAYGF